jgi:hypothetical protein
VTFEADSKLREIAGRSFRDCSALPSIYIPSSVEVLGEASFSRCEALAELRFEPGSQLRRIEALVFDECSSLTSIFLPGSVRELAPDWFHESGLVQVVFESVMTLQNLIDKGQFTLVQELEVRLQRTENEERQFPLLEYHTEDIDDAPNLVRLIKEHP